MNKKSIHSCVIEPTICERAILSCVFSNDGLTLNELDSLVYLTNSVLLFDEIIYLDTSRPTIRFKGSINKQEYIHSYIKDYYKWDFINCKLKIRDIEHSQDFINLYKTRLDKEYEIIEHASYKGSRVRIREHVKIPHPVINTESWDVLKYLDKINNAALKFDSTVIHIKSNAVNILSDLYLSRRALSVDLIEKYDAVIKERVKNYKLNNYREILHYAPMFLARAVSQAGDNNPKEILSIITQMRNEVTAKYRELCHELLIINQKKANSIYHDIETLLFNLASEDKKIPKAKSLFYKSFLTITKVLPALKGDEESIEYYAKKAELMFNAGKDVKDIYNEVEKQRNYQKLDFFNQYHMTRCTSDIFYNELIRVFGKVYFTNVELNRYLSGIDINDIYNSR